MERLDVIRWERMIDEVAAARASVLFTERYAVPVSSGDFTTSSVDSITRRCLHRHEIAAGALRLLDSAAILLSQTDGDRPRSVSAATEERICGLVQNAGVLEAALLRLAGSAMDSSERPAAVPLAA